MDPKRQNPLYLMPTGIREGEQVNICLDERSIGSTTEWTWEVWWGGEERQLCVSIHRTKE